jgi:hypothetical protein
MNKGRLFFPLLIILLTAGMFVTASPSFAYTHQTVVRGNIYSNTNISGIPVTVSCNGVTQQTHTNGNGLYTASFPPNLCRKYSFVSATIQVNGQTQTESVLVSSQNTATMDFSCNTLSVPEFGLIPGALATLTSIGSFLAIKRKRN